jgi:hypothetical protein
MENQMASNPRLFTVTQWLLRAAMVFCAFGATVLFLCLGGLALLGTEVWVPKEIPDMMEGVPRAHVFGIVALAMVAGLALLALATLIFRAIHQIVESAIGGDPFITENADRLSRIGWLLVSIFAVQAAMGAAMNVLVPAQLKDNLQFDGFGADFSPLGLLAILLVFVLAQIFRHGAQMRAELEGTV